MKKQLLTITELQQLKIGDKVTTYLKRKHESVWTDETEIDEVTVDHVYTKNGLDFPLPNADLFREVMGNTCIQEGDGWNMRLYKTV